MATLDASAREDNRKDSRPVVAAAAGVNLRCPPKLAIDDDECRVEQAAAVQISDKPRERPVEVG